MASKMLRALWLVALLAAVSGGARAAECATCSGSGLAGCATCSDGNTGYKSYYGADASGWRQTAPPIFTNYYVPPSCCGPGAMLYVSPLPVPPLTGHTYVTYQPWMPHEFMYHHHRTYYKWHPRGGNYTKVRAFWW
jgi:hypothetical protein